jgi:HAD-superfamily hydrolase, subfamily IIB
MAIKLFVTDLDGTLLNKNHGISEENKQAVQAAMQQGITVTVATGRMYASALPYAKQLGVDVPIITYNGALIKSVGGEVLYESYLKPQTVQDVLDFCIGRDWYIQTYKDDQLYFKEYSAEAQGYEALGGVKGEVVGAAGLHSLAENVPKMLVITRGNEESDRVVEALQHSFANRLVAVKSSATYVEIINPGVNKATALDMLLQKMFLTKAEVMAIGDSNNDLPMLKAAGHSVAMGNANEQVKAVCDYVTDDCAHSGVAKAIREYVLKG